MTDTHPTQRLQLALNVTDLDEAIDFYSRMFGAPPAKIRPGYANFAIANPPLKLVLFEGTEAGTINHLGVEVSSADEVATAEARLNASGIETTGIDETVCCYAEKTETWLNGPDGTRWEWYVKTGDADQMTNEISVDSDTTCCNEPATSAGEADEPVAAGVGADGSCC